MEDVRFGTSVRVKGAYLRAMFCTTVVSVATTRASGASWFPTDKAYKVRDVRVMQVVVHLCRQFNHVSKSYTTGAV